MSKAQQSPSPGAGGVAAAMSALILAVLLAALGQTIVSTALPRIAEDLNGFDDIAWVSAAYLLASTAVTPLWGKLGDMFGRKQLYLTSTTVFLIASVACGLAQNLPELIGARVLQGVGGGMIVLTFALVGDIVAPAERGPLPGHVRIGLRRRQHRRTPAGRGLHRPAVLAVGLPDQPARRCRRPGHRRSPERAERERRTAAQIGRSSRTSGAGTRRK